MWSYSGALRDSTAMILTHIGLVLEREPAARSSAVKVRRSLPEERAIGRPALLSCPVSLETLLDDCRVLPVVVGVHLDVGGRYVNFITALFDTVIVSLFLVVCAVGVSIRTVI